MLYQFLLNFVDTFGFLNVFKYLTFRTGLSFFTSLIIVLLWFLLTKFTTITIIEIIIIPKNKKAKISDMRKFKIL